MSRNLETEITERTLNSLITPRRTLFGETKHQLNDLRRHGRPSSALPAVAIIPVPGNEFAMPAEDCVRSHDGGPLAEHPAPEDLAFDGQAQALVVVKEDSLLPVLLPENPILRYEVLDSVRLIQPARIRSKNCHG